MPRSAGTAPDRGRLLRLLLAGALLLAAATAPAAGFSDSEFDDEQKPWSEIEAQLPAWPKDENLLRFEAGPVTSNRFYIDAPSLSVGADGVIRYTMVVRAAGGANNVFFEGIRCETREQKLYAVGRNDGRWTRARDPAWRFIEYKDLNRHHGVLFADFFCEVSRKGKPLPAKDILAALKRENVRMR
jgi:hypothetical protein